ncbi:TonB-dependent receptor [Sphingosinicella sp. LHD-64]|uniref:TonB-dependent receptor n=1 Tax=Sphingosinicella sp. LHD-64 TaxID=3072139 RepID=UPI00280D98A3|nr:TonB-dependent receptor [Sphingosinicella sp. LHD-64]MDQ8756238.1 TonB-dependent receptor [Sphingosinicella sp. LHD-64]
MFTPSDVAGFTAPELRGEFTLRQALDRLLPGTGLAAEYRGGTVLVRGRSQSSPQEVTEGMESETEILVTGTRIRGRDTPSPRIVATRQSLENAGVNDMAGFSRVIAQNYTGGQNPGVAGAGDQGGQSNINNSTTLNLRGLGPDATLTLINGHRLAYDALLQGIDISAIPLAAIDRVEVITDGASALYGSDAVAGVANLVLRRDFSGVQATARLGASTDGGNVQQQYTIVGGSRWSSGGFMLAADYNRITPILAPQREYTRRLNDAQMLTARQHQISAVLAGHQRIGEGVTFELDAQFASRDMRKTTAFTLADPIVNGSTTHPSVRSYAITPLLRLDLPSDWTATLETTRSVSETIIRTRSFRNGVETPARASYENRLWNIEVNGEGPLFAAPGGEVRLAVGAGYRAFELGINVTRTIGGVRQVRRDATEERESQFAYGEVSIPFVGPGNRAPFLHALQLSAAVRYERYQGIEEVATPKLGLIYEPHRDVTFKLSWGRAFKIPTLDQVNEIQAGGIIPGNFFVPLPLPPLPSGATVLVLTGGNPQLRAERARTWTATVEVRPRILEGLQLEASYFDIDYRDRIGIPISDTLSVLANPAFADFVLLRPSAQQVIEIVEALPQPITNVTGQPFDPARVGAIVDARLRNTARERARGVDLAMSYETNLTAQDRLLITTSASYLDATRQIRMGLPAVPRSGVIFSPPEWRFRAGANWERDNVQLSAFLNYVGSVRDNRLATSGGVGSFTTLDLTASARTTATSGPFRNMEFRLSALNLLNEQPDIIRTTDPAAIPYDSTNQSAIGRFVSFSVTKRW